MVAAQGTETCFDILGWRFTFGVDCLRAFIKETGRPDLLREFLQNGGRGLSRTLAQQLADNQRLFGIPTTTVHRMPEPRIVSVGSHMVVLEPSRAETHWLDGRSEVESHRMFASDDTEGILQFIANRQVPAWLIRPYLSGRHICIDLGFSKTHRANLAKFTFDDGTLALKVNVDDGTIIGCSERWLLHAEAVDAALRFRYMAEQVLHIHFAVRLHTVVKPNAGHWQVIDLRPVPLHVQTTPGNF